ncbi:unnamed protein product [Closterium sp. NIES-64]|nr:unnamed protein product [Closterium sp. NIES-64]
MIQFYPSAEEALDHGFSEFVSPQVLASLRALFQHNDASTRGVFFEQLSSTRTSINGWMRKVALTALGRQANKCYLGRLPADLLAPLEFYTDEELIARYKDGERGLAWHRELLIPFGSLIFSVSIKLALARRGVNSEKIKTRQLGWILYAFEWPILNNAPDGKLSGKWEYNRIHIAEFLPSHPSPSSHLIRPLPPISSVPFFPSHPSPLFPSHPSPSSHLIRPLPPISSVPFFPSHPSPSSLLIRPLPPISSVPFLPSPSVPYASLHRLHDLHQPGGSRGTGAEQQGQQGDRCGAAVQHRDRCGAAVAAWGQVRSSSGSMGTGVEQQGQHGDRCGAAVAAWGQVRSSREGCGSALIITPDKEIATIPKITVPLAIVTYSFFVTKAAGAKPLVLNAKQSFDIISGATTSWADVPGAAAAKLTGPITRVARSTKVATTAIVQQMWLKAGAGYPAGGDTTGKPFTYAGLTFAATNGDMCTKIAGRPAASGIRTLADAKNKAGVAEVALKNRKNVAISSLSWNPIVALPAKVPNGAVAKAFLLFILPKRARRHLPAASCQFGQVVGSFVYGHQ